jgi:replicative DNA helicase
MNSEASILAMILRDEDLWYTAALKKDYFDSPGSRAIFDAIEKALAVHGYISRETVMSQLPDPAIIDRLLRDAGDFTGNLDFHRKQIVTDWKRREISASMKVTDSELASGKDPDTLADSLIDGIRAIRTENPDDSSVAYRELVRKALSAIEKRFNELGELPGISTGIRALDGILGGLQARRLYFVGARPSQGKSALLGQMADHIARSGKSVGYFSLESSSDEILIRNWSRKYGIRQTKIQSGIITPKELVSFKQEIDLSKNMQLWIDDTPNCDLAHIKRQAAIWKMKNKIDILFVDYVQIIRVTGAADRREAVEEASRSLKDISRQLDIPVVAAAQLRRDVDGREPHLGDFQHSSALEQDADSAILLHWLDNFSEEVAVDAIIAKNRDGQKAKVQLTFIGPVVKFEQRKDNLDDADEYLEGKGASGRI